MIPRKLNLGSGEKYLHGWINVDACPTVIADAHLDLNTCWPWEDSSVDYILMDNVLEHLDDVVATMKQIQRVLKPGCSAFIIVPYAHTEGAVYDPQHKHLFLPQTFHYFTPEGPPYTRMNFKAKTRLTCLSHNAHLRIRTIIPFRSLLTRFIRNMYDCVEATMTKMDPAAP